MENSCVAVATKKKGAEMTVITTVEFTQVCENIDGNSITKEDKERFIKRLQVVLEKMCTADHIEITNVQVFPTNDI